MKLPAIKVKQPFGDFFVVSIDSEILNRITYSDYLKVRNENVEGYETSGNQRKKQVPRVKEIGSYIETTDAAFPNSIILAANYDEYGNSIIEEDDRWKLIKEGSSYFIQIPENGKTASIIDGQHRLEGFKYAKNYKKPFECLCTIYLDLPAPLQAFLFATVNFHQKPVEKSIAYELFGTGLKHQDPNTWTPEKTAIFLTRKLNLNPDSPLYNHIIISAQQDEELQDNKLDNWLVSTATIVDGMLRLFSKKPKADRTEMHKYEIESRKRTNLQNDNSPLRIFYIENNDLFIYKVVFNFFMAAKKILFDSRSANSYIVKTVGIQALFQFLNDILVMELMEKKDISIDYYSSFFEKVRNIDFSDTFFQASGIGRSRILNVIRLRCQLVNLSDFKNNAEEYRIILDKYSE